MKSRLPNVPILKRVGARIGAGHYNRVQLGLKRLGGPLRLMLPGMRGFQVTIESDLWVCTDRNMNQLPILAWTDFNPGARDGLAQPVPCRLLFYHPYANVVIRTVVDDIAKILSARLKRLPPAPGGAEIIKFPSRGRG